MKNVLKLIFSSLLVLPFTMNAQQQDFPAGTTPNEHNINGADYPRIGEDRRAHFRIHAPNAQKVEISFRGEMTKEADGYWSLVSKEPEVVGFHYYQVIIDGVSAADPNGKPFFGMGKWVSGIEIPEKWCGLLFHQERASRTDQPKAGTTLISAKNGVDVSSILRRNMTRTLPRSIRCSTCNMVWEKTKRVGQTRAR